MLQLTMLSRLFKKLKTYRHLSRELRHTCPEAFYHLILAKFLIQFIPMRFFAKYLGIKNTQGSSIDTKMYEPIFQLIRQSIRIVSHNLPWESKCLDQAMAAQWMLDHRSLPGTLYFGVKRSESLEKPYGAHAWVCCGDSPVIGSYPDVHYSVVGIYSLV
ncbi:MAG: lasso peptide biosynthesis B2 protein [Chlamydiae bacterium]|nr:lasso peptide biosynthesis B2 protein [Chlamydiota bacterium]